MRRNHLSDESARVEHWPRDWPQNVHPAAWQNPRPASRYKLVVIGGGTAGLVAAHAAAALGAKVALVERHLLGGDCLNFGCVPSKTLLRSAHWVAHARDGERFGGVALDDARVDFTAVMERMRRVRARVSRNDSVQRLREAGVDLFFGAACFAGPDAVVVDGATLRFHKALIATGSRPVMPTVPGLVDAGYHTHESIFDLTELPRRLLVMGGGPLGCEFAQAFCRFGSHTIIAQDEPMFLPKEERDAAQMVSDSLARDGVEIHLNSEVVRVRTDGKRKLVDLVSDEVHSTVEVDEILTGIGRAPNVEAIGLEAAGVAYDHVNGVRVDDFLRSTNKNIYAAGDACLPHKFTHTADAAARIVVRNALFPGGQRWSRLTIPWCTYTDPSVAHVGLYVREARERRIPVKTFTILMHDVDRAIADGEEHGFVKIHVREGSDTILGATIVATRAGDMINEITLAMVAGIGLATLADVIHAYPTQSEAIKKAADACRRAQLTPALAWLARRWLAR
ncbi:MAG: mercuric reductase [Betaproteobacteria bacterium]|nr:MAG: mercuric reductase [Betaproteobacteria bacterium]TMH29526.1 MAG: mercuric reductase [Betaproteobacteria bacterium]